MSLLDHYNSLKRDFKITSRQQSDTNEKFPLRVSAWVIAVFENRLDKFEDFDEALRSTLSYLEKKPTTPDDDTISPMTQEDLLDILGWYNELLEPQQESKAQQLEQILESIRAEHVQDYLSQRQDKSSATYDDYLKWLSTQRIPADQAVSKIWFDRKKSAHFKANVTTKEPKSASGRAIAKGSGNASYRQPTNPVPAPKPTASAKSQTAPRKRAKNRFTVEDQIEVERLVKRQGLRLEVSYGEEHAIELSSYVDSRRAQVEYVLSGSVLTGDRGPRTDHGGGDDGEDWMSYEDITRHAEPYRKKWQPKADALQASLRGGGYPTATVRVDYGEKGHITLAINIEVVWKSSSKKWS